MSSPISIASGQEDVVVVVQQHDTPLQMDFWTEELSQVQSAYYSKAEKEYKEIMSKVSEFISKEKGEVVERGTDVMVLQGSSGTSTMSVLSNLVTPVSQSTMGTVNKSRLISLQQPPQLQAVSTQQLVIQSGAVTTGARAPRTSPSPHTSFQSTPGTFHAAPGTIHLVVDPTLGLLVGTVPNQQHTGNQIIQATATQQTAPPVAVAAAPPKARQNTSARSVIKPPVTTSSIQHSSAPVATTVTAPIRPNTPTIKPTVPPRLNTPTTKPRHKTVPAIVAHPHPPSSVIPASTTRPTESNSVGGLAAGNPGKKVSQGESKSGASGPDSREMSFNKVSGKTFPSLVVLARPNLRVKEIAQTKVNQERSALDSKVKCVLMYSATKFTEWLIQQGLVKGEQFCNTHKNPDGPYKLKLGMYSDSTKFPFSGGYVWISDCCPQRFVSVFSGSIFEGAPHPPTVLLKLMYHWCCQTNVQNVVQWVRVDNLYVKNFFTYMRSVCVAAVHEKHEKLGGPQKRVEVGVISLGTTSQDGNMRQVKVEVLGVMDPESKLVRLKAIEPLQDGERNYKRRFVKILEPLDQWVHKESIIVTDFTVDKSTLITMGFSQVYQSTIPDPPSSSNKLSNQNIMEYLRRIVPRMFQNTLSLLSRQIIQQFLDELVWRERWGSVPSQAFDSLISHLSSQTKIDSGETLIVKLGKIASNPFRSWEYENWKNSGIVNSPLYTIPNNGRNSPVPPPVMPPLSPMATPVQFPLASSLGFEKFHHTSIALSQPFEYKISEEVQKRLESAVEKIDSGGMSVRKAIEVFNLPRSVLLDKAKEVLKNKVALGHAVFSEEEERDIKDHLMTLHDWGYPFGRWDIRLVVKQYLDTYGRTEHRFKENFPGDLWIEKFLGRHQVIREKLCRNIPSRGHFIEGDSVKQYILNISSVIQNVPPENILNFMEIGLTGDPLRSMTLELRELRYPVGKRKVKSAAAVMLACTALGKMLPSFIIFEGKPITIDKGPSPGEYCATKTGWFDETAFQQWLESVLLPWADGLKGKKIVVGDSLAQLFSVRTLALCLDKDITFVCMPCNITGVLSPLDVVLCDKLRSQWRAQIRTWASSHSDKYITLEDFPIHIHELLSTTISQDMPEQIRTAFKVIGLFPFNSKNTMQALENGGVELHNPHQKKDSASGKKRKQIFIGTDDISAAKKKPVKEQPIIEEVVLDEEKDAERDLAAIEEALKSSDNLILLDEYYYGISNPVAELVHNEFKTANLTAKCPMCQTVVASNLELMKHLLGHSEHQPTPDELLELHQCRYCVKNLPSSEELESHVQEEHKSLSSKIACLLCAEKFTSKQTLIVHMQKTHTKLELPYHCSICNFRSSEQFKLVDHFYEVHANGEKIQCPFCLKCVAISNLGKKMPANTFFFMHHVRKHLSRNSARKCDKCALWFVHKGILKEHLAKDHLSCENDPDVVPYSNISKDRIMMPLPKHKLITITRIEKPVDISCKQLDHVKLTSVGLSVSCIECKSNFHDGNHFVHLACSLCGYGTFCTAAMKKHTQVFHCKERPLGRGTEAVLLPQNIHCCCGFKTKNGNLMAKHLATTSCTVTYCSPFGRPASASFPPLVSLDETAEDPSVQWIRAYASKTECDESSREKALPTGPPSMLNLLGLVRKTEEHSESQTKSVDRGDGSSKDQPSIQSSTCSSISVKRKRSADEAFIESSQQEINSGSKSNPTKMSLTSTDVIQESHCLPNSESSSKTDTTSESLKDEADTHVVSADKNVHHEVPLKAEDSAASVHKTHGVKDVTSTEKVTPTRENSDSSGFKESFNTPSNSMVEDVLVSNKNSINSILASVEHSNNLICKLSQSKSLADTPAKEESKDCGK